MDVPLFPEGGLQKIASPVYSSASWSTVGVKSPNEHGGHLQARFFLVAHRILDTFLSVGDMRIRKTGQYSPSTDNTVPLPD